MRLLGEQLTQFGDAQLPPAARLDLGDQLGRKAHPQQSRRIARDDRIGRDIGGDDRARADDRAAPDMLAVGQDHRIMPDPDVILDNQRRIPMDIGIDRAEFALIKRGMRCQRLIWMIDRRRADAARDRAIAADLDRAWHPPLVKTAIGIKTYINPMLRLEIGAQLRIVMLIAQPELEPDPLGNLVEEPFHAADSGIEKNKGAADAS